MVGYKQALNGKCGIHFKHLLRKYFFLKPIMFTKGNINAKNKVIIYHTSLQPHHMHLCKKVSSRKHFSRKVKPCQLKGAITSLIPGMAEHFRRFFHDMQKKEPSSRVGKLTPHNLRRSSILHVIITSNEFD